MTLTLKAHLCCLRTGRAGRPCIVQLSMPMMRPSCQSRHGPMPTGSFWYVSLGKSPKKCSDNDFPSAAGARNKPVPSVRFVLEVSVVANGIAFPWLHEVLMVLVPQWHGVSAGMQCIVRQRPMPCWSLSSRFAFGFSGFEH